MTSWSLSKLLGALHDDIERNLQTARQTLGHPVVKGDATEGVWLKMLDDYLPQRYRAATAHVVDSLNTFSEQIDIVIFDRQYTPLVFRFGDKNIIPAEGVYAVFEAKQTINSGLIKYAQDKVASVRRLHRTSLPIPHAGGVYGAKALPDILGGILAFESDWTPALGQPLTDSLDKSNSDSRLDLGCVAAHGLFCRNSQGQYDITSAGKPATAFLFELIARLQSSATVPMIDVRAYAKWLTP
jgi:hypothetical protein